MRPIELTIRGFRSYRDEARFSFEGRRLVGVVGPIGSGKSSILEAISLALFGKTPTVGDGGTALIHQTDAAAHVALDFDVEGTRYRAVRAIRRKGASEHALYRVADGDTDLVASGKRAMNAEVEDLVGLDFDAFTRSVLLAQNQFAQFLTMTTTERSGVLKKVFGLERLDAMRTVAAQRRSAAEGELAELARRRREAEADRAELAAATDRLQQATKRFEELEGLVSEAERLGGVVSDSTARSVDRRNEIKRLTSLAERIPKPEESSQILSIASTAADRLRQADAAREGALAARREAEERIKALVEAGQSPEHAAALERALGTLEAARRASDQESARAEQLRGRVESGEAAVATAQRRLADSEAEAAAAGESVDASRKAVEVAETNLHEARHADMASQLRLGLNAGSPCPVCEQMVTTVPEATGATEVDAAERRLTEAKRSLEEAQRSRNEADRSVAAATQELASSADSLATFAADAASAAAAAAERAQEVEAATKAVTELVGERDASEALTEMKAAWEGAEQRHAEAAAAVERAAVDAEEARTELDRSAGELTSLASRLSDVAGRLDMEVAIGTDAATLEAALAAVRNTWIERRHDAEQAANNADAEAAQATTELEAMLVAADVDPKKGLDAAVAEAREVRAAAGAQVDVLTERLRRVETLDAEEAANTRRLELLERVAADLAPSRFPTFLLDEYRRLLSDLAGEQFELLTSGRYRFSDDGEFSIVDLTAADRVRASTSLSGGETFLASLALALGLAEIVGRQGARLDAFFLDEGFGSLDPEHLDLAMDGIERLVDGSAERLVVLVSHVEAMKERIDDLIVLDKDPVTGTTEVVRA